MMGWDRTLFVFVREVFHPTWVIEIECLLDEVWTITIFVVLLKNAFLLIKITLCNIF